MLQDLPQCAGCSLICRHFSVRIGLIPALSGREREREREVEGGEVRWGAQQARCVSSGSTAPLGSHLTGKSAQVRALRWKRNQIIQFSQRGPFCPLPLLRARGADSLKGKWGPVSLVLPNSGLQTRTTATVPDCSVRRGGSAAGMKPDTEEVKRGGCSNMLFRIIRGLVAARKYSHIPDGGSERTNQITAPRLPAVKCLIKGACSHD